MSDGEQKEKKRMKPRSRKQERIMEKLSISVPAPKLLPTVKPIWKRYLGWKVRLQLKDGTEIGGVLREILWDWIRLENVLEVGKDYRLNADWVMVDASTVSRFYPANAQVE
jgi:hypothetical protein